jgi:mono/diheme cytochrome c family protein
MTSTILAKATLRTIAVMALFIIAIPHSAAAQSGNGEGQKVYDQNCAKCHGADGVGIQRSERRSARRICVHQKPRR